MWLSHSGSAGLDWVGRAKSRRETITISTCSAPLESGFVLTFAMFFLGLRWPRYGALIFAPGLILVAVGLFGNQAQISELFLFIGVPAGGLYLGVLALIVAQSVLKRQDVARFVLCCTLTIVLLCWIRAMLSVLQTPPRGPIFSRPL